MKNDGAWRNTMPRSISSRLDVLSGTLVRRGGATAATGCFTAFSSRDSRFFAGEFVRGSFLVRGASTLCGDRTLRLGIHRCESARSLPTHGAGVSYIRWRTAACVCERAAVSADSAIVAGCITDVSTDATIVATRSADVSADRSAPEITGAAASSAPLVHSISLVVSSVYHYRSPAAISS